MIIIYIIHRHSLSCRHQFFMQIIVNNQACKYLKIGIRLMTWIHIPSYWNSLIHPSYLMSTHAIKQAITWKVKLKGCLTLEPLFITLILISSFHAHKWISKLNLLYNFHLHSFFTQAIPCLAAFLQVNYSPVHVQWFLCIKNM